MRIPTYIIPIVLCLFFFVAFSTLAIVRHQHYQSYGYDLGINDQTVWRYATLQRPVSTIDPFPDKTKFATHVELIYAVISPIYWVWNSVYMLLLTQVAIVCSGAYAIYLLARKYGLSYWLSNTFIIVYMLYYGVQFGLWTDVHSSIFGAACVTWFIYVLDTRRSKLTFLFFLLAITSKETAGSGVFLVSLVYWWYRREKKLLVYAFGAAVYMLGIFYWFYPYVMHVSYLYQNNGGLFSNLNPFSLIDTNDKRMTILYSFASWGFLPLGAPVFLLPVLGHFTKFFVLASDLSGAQGIFGQYRIGLAPFFSIGTIWFLKNRSKRIQMFAALWLLVCTFGMQYYLHLPLSYLTKQWFWTTPRAVGSIEDIRQTYLPADASVVAQDNILPHLSHRDKVYTLYPEERIFTHNAPCEQEQCAWFRWYGDPQYLFVDLSPEWDIRMWLANRDEFIDGLHALEKAGVITKYKQEGTTYLYKVNMNPSDYGR